MEKLLQAQTSIKAEKDHPLLSWDFPSWLYSTDTICDPLLPFNPENTAPTNLKEVQKSMNTFGIQ